MLVRWAVKNSFLQPSIIVESFFETNDRAHSRSLLPHRQATLLSRACPPPSEDHGRLSSKLTQRTTITSFVWLFAEHFFAFDLTQASLVGRPVVVLCCAPLIAAPFKVERFVKQRDHGYVSCACITGLYEWNHSQQESTCSSTIRFARKLVFILFVLFVHDCEHERYTTFE